MSGTRGRGLSVIGGTAVKVGGMATDDGATARTGGAGVQVRPAFQSAAGQIQPLPPVGGAHVATLFDLSSVISWRLFIVAAAAAYILGFHVTLGGKKVGVGPGLKL